VELPTEDQTYRLLKPKKTLTKGEQKTGYKACLSGNRAKLLFSSSLD
jgi:hypothetical protein